MADYSHSINKVLRHEGGYANDPVDRGGETYKGISRKAWPKWQGWTIIDAAKKRADFPNSLYANNQLNQLVIDFYKINFWQKIGGDFLADQDIADILMDAAVNEGIKAAVKRAQKIVHLPETGIIDNELLKRLNVLI